MIEVKNLDYTTMTVGLPYIDLAPGPFSMSFSFDLEVLRASIEEFGVLNPPYLLTGQDGKLLVVAGYRRIAALKQLGWPEIQCRILPDDFSPFQALLLNLNDNMIHRQLNNIEKGMVLRRLIRFVKKDEILRAYMPLLDLPANGETLDVFLRLEDFEEKIRFSIATERLSLKVAGLMMQLKQQDRLKVAELFGSAKWSFNQQREAFQMIIEIAEREGCEIGAVIDHQPIKELLSNKEINNPQRIKSIVSILKVRRFPYLSEATQLFHKSVSGLRLPDGVKVIPPAFFEGPTYRLEMTFLSGVELKEKVAELSRVVGLEGVTEFWKKRA